MPETLFALPPGVDFPRALVSGLLRRMGDQPPEAMARVTLYLNTNRMRDRVRQVFAEQGALILPRLRVLTDIAPDRPFAGIPEAVPALRRRLELAQLVDRLLQAQPDLAPRAALYDLADSLAALMEEMQVEGVSPDRIAALDVSDHSAHWARTQNFLRIVNGFFDGSSQPDAGARQRMIVDRLVALWQAAPPPGPVILGTGHPILMSIKSYPIRSAMAAASPIASARHPTS